jgi:hypothetical protein
MEFSHPLARMAKIWPLINVKRNESKVLIIVTTLNLDAKSEKYKAKLVERLSVAAQEFIHKSGDATGFILINRLREWKLTP